VAVATANPPVQRSRAPRGAGDASGHAGTRGQPLPPRAGRTGKYLGWGYSRHGDIQAQVVIENGRIAYAVIAKCLTRYSLLDSSSILQKQVGQRQGPEVDYVAGATESADAFLRRGRRGAEASPVIARSTAAMDTVVSIRVVAAAETSERQLRTGGRRRARARLVSPRRRHLLALRIRKRAGAVSSQVGAAVPVSALLFEPCSCCRHRGRNRRRVRPDRRSAACRPRASTAITERVAQSDALPEAG
jgi:uncharacterized protein with FMN-binding domain